MGYVNRFAAFAAALAIGSACTVRKADEGPAPFGPSGLSLSIGLTASPDSISQDGASQSSIVVTAHDASGRPKAGVVFRLDMSVDGSVQDFGQLAARTVVTGTDGRASTIYTAPPTSPLSGGTGSIVSIIARPISANFQTAQSRTADIRLVPPGVVLPPAGTPTAKFTFSSPVNFNIPVTFDASSSCAGPLTGVPPQLQCLSSDTITSYAWNFGDGSTASGRVVTHAFTGGTSFNVTLTVTNNRGLSASDSKTVPVSAAPVPTGDWVYSPAQPAVNQTIYFNADTVRPPVGRTFVRYDWNFGDGSLGATGSQTTHAYIAAANYVVVLTLRDDVGVETVKQQTISIGTGNPSAVFTSSVSNATTHTVDFDATASTAQGGATISSYSWAFGDGLTGTGQTVSHSYPAAGTYTVRLTVTDSLKRTGTLSQSVTVP